MKMDCICKQLCLPTLLIATLCSTFAFAAESPVPLDQGYIDQRFTIGYRIVETQDNPNRAAEYESNNSSVTLGADVEAGQGPNHLSLGLDYLDQDDYRGDAHFDYKGLLRLTLFTDAFFHNLDHVPYLNRPVAITPGNPAAVPVATGPSTLIDYADANPGDHYGVKLEQYGGKFRGKHPGIPAHLNLGYWRLERSGEQQLRYVAEGSPCSTCHMRSQTRKLDRVTEEVTAGFDVHLGPVDLVYEFLNRDFRDQQPIPIDPFEGLAGQRISGDWEHDEAPDSRLTSHTVQAHTSLSGGVVGAASFTIGQRENRSDLRDVRPVESETDFQKTAGDLTLTPFSQLTINLRYRLLDMDNDNSDTLVVDSLNVGPNNPPNTINVRENVDLTTATYEASLSYRPVRRLTLKADYKREDIHRGNTGAPFLPNLFTAFGGVHVIDPYWELPEDEVINRYKVSFYARPLDKGRLKLRGWYQYRTSDDPAYGTSVEEGHRGFAALDWLLSPRFGVNTTVRADRTAKQNQTVLQFDDSANLQAYDLDRKNENQNFSAGLWLNPGKGSLITANYGYLRSKIVQDLLIGNEPSQANIEADDVDYLQRVQTVSVGIQWRIVQNLLLRTEGRHIRSRAYFDPQFSSTFSTFSNFPPGAIAADSTGLRDLTELNIEQNGLSAGFDWTLVKGWDIAGTYTYDAYDDRTTGLYEGKVQTYLANLSRSW